MPLRFNFLYLGAMIAVAAAIQGNPLATLLAIAAVVLTFIEIKFPQKLSLSPPLVRGERDRKRTIPITENHMKYTAAEVKNKMGLLVSEGVQKAMGATMALEKNPGDANPAVVELCANTALCVLVPVVPFLVKKPMMTREQAAKDPNKLLAMINFETILYGALIAARMHVGMRAAGELEKLDAGDGIVVTGETEFGPEILYSALEDWKKVTGKNPADYFNADLLKAIEESHRDSLAPFDEFLKSRTTSVPVSKTLQ
jgi:hypothetical protein